MDWTRQESAARRVLRGDLRQYLAFARAAHGLVEAAADVASKGQRSTPPSHIAHVQIRLLVRISHELRVIELAAKNSYALQALWRNAGYQRHHADRRRYHE